MEILFQPVLAYALLRIPALAGRFLLAQCGRPLTSIVILPTSDRPSLFGF